MKEQLKSCFFLFSKKKDRFYGKMERFINKKNDFYRKVLTALSYKANMEL